MSFILGEFGRLTNRSIKILHPWIALDKKIIKIEWYEYLGLNWAFVKISNAIRG